MSDDAWDAPSQSSPGSAAARTTASTDVRFAESHVLGAGTSGRIVEAFDRHLARDVALKVVDGSSPDAVGRLAREAAILAGLEHPGIVTLYDVAPRDDGGLQLALRIVRGRTLEAALADASPSDTRRLLDNLVTVSEAMAFAHRRGVVHRDLKPANVMIGAFGETQVIDWGLACVRGDDAPAAAEPPEAWNVEPTLSHPGAVLGTPRYMSPEQARGEPVDARADVWALGVMLYEIVHGRPAFAQPTTEAALRAVRADERPAWPGSGDAAIAEVYRHATAPLARRFGDAGVFHAALAAALTPPPRRRVWLGLAALATTAALVVIATRECQPATRRVDLASTSERALAEAHAVEAQRLLADGHVPEAEQLAARSLARVPTPEALGVLAATSRGVRPRLIAASDVPRECTATDLDADGAHWLCSSDRGVALYDGPTQRWQIPGRDLSGVFVGERVLVVREQRDDTVVSYEGRLFERDGRPTDAPFRARCSRPPKSAYGGALVFLTSRSCLEVVSAYGRELIPLGPQSLQAVGGDHAGHFAAVFWTGEIVQGQVDLSEHGASTVHSLRPNGIGPSANEVSAVRPLADGRIVLATVHGDVFVVDADSRELARARLGATSISAISASPGGEVIGVSGEHAGPRVLTTLGLQTRAQLPLADAGALVLIDSEHAATLGARHARWSVPKSPPSMIDGYTGIVSLATDGDGVALAFGDTLAWLDLADGHEGGRVSEPSPFKAIALAPDGSYSAIGVLQTRAVRVAPPTLERLPIDTQDFTAGRRIVYTKNGTAVIARYSPHVLAAVPPDAFVTIAREEALDIAAQGDHVALLTAAHELILLALSPAPIELARCPVADAQAVALSPDASTFYVARAGEVEAIDAITCMTIGLYDAGRDPHRVTAHAAPSELVVSHDGAWIAVGTRDGHVLVWGVGGALALALAAHGEVVSALAFDPRGHFLATGSWDGSMRLLDLAVLEQPAARLVADVYAAWGP